MALTPATIALFEALELLPVGTLVSLPADVALRAFADFTDDLVGSKPDGSPPDRRVTASAATLALVAALAQLSGALVGLPRETWLTAFADLVADEPDGSPADRGVKTRVLKFRKRAE